MIRIYTFLFTPVCHLTTFAAEKWKVGLNGTDASAEGLSELTFLEKLSVRGTGVTWDGVDKLKKAMPETYIFK